MPSDGTMPPFTRTWRWRRKQARTQFEQDGHQTKTDLIAESQNGQIFNPNGTRAKAGLKPAFPLAHARGCCFVSLRRYTPKLNGLNNQLQEESCRDGQRKAE